jgi:hypothetical protein
MDQAGVTEQWRKLPQLLPVATECVDFLPIAGCAPKAEG